ncbi:hypothetical protein [Halomicronema sp. CCY15110]|jgi:hypothetical protein|uniref:hypothetical protein n=1 Tax=Halomicronema sp. CCY15110 TaxID=2767773 RepID=UPI001950234D|nr:hypothetical protein [Halomicronema sp. CCY15110]
MKYFVVISHKHATTVKGTVLVRAADMVDAGDIAAGIDSDATTIMSFELFMK